MPFCDIYPNRTKTEIVGDASASALAELVPKTHRGTRGKIVDNHPELGNIYEASGAAAEFIDRAPINTSKKSRRSWVTTKRQWTCLRASQLSAMTCRMTDDEYRISSAAHGA